MFLEEVLRRLRVNKIKKYIKNGAVVCDIGCGQSAFLLKSIKNSISKGYGFDKKIDNLKKDNLEICHSNLAKEINLPSNSIDVITLLAVLEHVEYPEDILKDCYRPLKDSGRIIITTPAPRSKNLLEFLAFKFNILSQEEIGSHLRYFNLSELKDLLIKLGFKIVKAQQFQFGFNNFIVAQK
ncbi:MAG: class I SAM-dependent methyltransferase [Patescibacteria group bacterium]|nr:class I SAM-dependent methyltransferase [Patescibacteria group bacterium]MDD5121339.1 class I SAM-dependent methyltransferase [Patescibacteria group bacterium]MDD5395742.1 class I SAM-dependent methyltransferase [Patescibacteria group bacterium]